MNISGSYKLVSFQIEENPTTVGSNPGVRDWGHNTHGLLIYSKSGHMSVSINKDIENDTDQSDELNTFDSILFYSGTYQLEGNLIKHQVTNASNPTRIGKEMLRYAEFKNDQLILTTPQESFGRAILTWKKI